MVKMVAQNVYLPKKSQKNLFHFLGLKQKFCKLLIAFYEKGARAVRTVHNAVRAQCGRFPRARTTFSFPLCYFLAPHHYLPLPCGEPVCRGCEIGRASLESKGK